MVSNSVRDAGALVCLCRSDSDTPDQGRTSVYGNAGERLAAYRAKCPRDKIDRGSTYKSHKGIQVCGLSLCCQSRDTRGTLCKRTAWWTQLADVYGRRCISAKYHKTKTPKRHYERISRREREENNVICTLYLLGAITYEQNKTISGRRSILLCSSCLFI